jgi:hypothetical protein
VGACALFDNRIGGRKFAGRRGQGPFHAPFGGDGAGLEVRQAEYVDEKCHRFDTAATSACNRPARERASPRVLASELRCGRGLRINFLSVRQRLDPDRGRLFRPMSASH